MRAPVLAAALLLAGCASVTPRPAQAPALAAELHLSGRLSVQVENATDLTGRGGNAGFDLSGGPAHGVLELSTPLGSLIARARWDQRPGQAGEAVLETPGHERHFDDLNALTREMLGESIPVEALFDWLQGRAWAGSPSTPLPEAGNVGFEQLGWRVDLRRFADGLLVATRQGDPVVTLRARVESKD